MNDLQMRIRGPGGGQRASKHNLALVFPEKQEKPILFMLQAWADYARESERHYGRTIGTNPGGTIRVAWMKIGAALMTLIRKGDLGRLDAETLELFIYSTINENDGEST